MPETTTLPTPAQLQMLALCRIDGLDWRLVAREGQRPGGLERLLQGEVSEASAQAEQMKVALRVGLPKLEALLEELMPSIELASSRGARLTTVLDDDYPANLRTIYNLPPFLFYRGDLRSEDAYGVAVVGTRQASDEGRRRAAQMTRALVERGVTILSGLARGIDTVAHQVAVSSAGRTVAVVGTGILKTYPSENAELAERIVESGGAIVSQFVPLQPPTSYNFPRRNVVMSGIGQGTVVIEASRTSGAKMQARYSLEHGRKVFLLQSLVTSQPWALGYLSRGAIEVASVDDVTSRLRSAESLVTHAGELRALSAML